MICGSATEKMRTSDFRRRTSVGLRGCCMRRPRGARVARSLKSEVGSHHLVIAQGLSPVRLFLTQSRRGAEAAELCVRIYGGPVPVESYDAKSRRVKKVTPNATTTFFYDDWNLVEERIAYADNTTSTIRYYWGKDLSGTLQGAGGVGGLLWLTVDGTIYIPCYDNNGNVTRYLSVNGGTFARYSYDAFGRLIARVGRRASFFRHRFSTKYYDTETGLYYYGYRFYHPGLMRWPNRDPLEEEGGVNLFEYCRNSPMIVYDLLGMRWKVLRDKKTFAVAIPCDAGDTFETLSHELKLDYSDYKKWAHTDDQIPVMGKKYKVPNVVYFHYGKRKLVDYLSGSLFSFLISNSDIVIQLQDRLGYRVVVKRNVNGSQIIDALRTDGIYQYTYIGHGDNAWINTYPDDVSLIVAPDRYTLYGINLMNLFACESASVDISSAKIIKRTKRKAWRSNVAKVGTFRGYSNEVNLINQHVFTVVRKGMNSNEKK